jgi:uncharacterized membrane protein YheB (UPF0754 family)
MDSQTIISGAVTISVGALSGGITNAVAVWMLFHPHDPVRIGPFSLQGAIPKNKARLARSVGKTVGERLLTADDLSRRLSDPTLRTAFDAAIGRGVRGLLERDHGPLAGSLGAEAVAAVDRALPALAGRAAEQVAAYVRAPAFAAAVEQRVAELAARLGEQPIGSALRADDRAALKEQVERWAAGVADGEELARAIRGVIATELEKLTADECPLIERLPTGMVAALEQAIADSLPGVIERVGDALERPEARAQVLGVVREGIDRAVREMVLHQRLLAKLVVTDQAIARLLDSFAGQGADRLAAELRGGTLQGQLRQSVADAVQAALRVPLGERLRRLGPERRATLADNLADLALTAVRSEAMRGVLSQALDRFLGEADRRTWGELLRALPASAVAGVLGDALAAETGRQWVADTVTEAARGLLARPLGRPATWLGADAVDTLTIAASDAAWRWVHEQVPIVVGHLRVQEMVEQKVLGFSTQKMEEIVRTVTQRELDLIVNLGYWLGGLVGVIAFGINLLFR